MTKAATVPTGEPTKPGVQPPIEEPPKPRRPNNPDADPDRIRDPQQRPSNAPSDPTGIPDEPSPDGDPRRRDQP